MIQVGAVNPYGPNFNEETGHETEPHVSHFLLFTVISKIDNRFFVKKFFHQCFVNLYT